MLEWYMLFSSSLLLVAETTLICLLPFSLMPYFCKFDQSLYTFTLLLLLSTGQCIILHNTSCTRNVIMFDYHMKH
jgi:hypothetical protein